MRAFSFPGAGGFPPVRQAHPARSCPGAFEGAFAGVHLMEYSRFTLVEHEDFVDWLRVLPDLHARLAIVRRLDRLRRGHAGHVQAAGSGVFWLQVHGEPAFRLFVHRHGPCVTVLHACLESPRAADHARHAIALARSLDTRTLHEPRPPL